MQKGNTITERISRFKEFFFQTVIAERTVEIVDFKILRNIPDLHKNDKKLYISNEVLQNPQASLTAAKLKNEARAVKMQQFDRNR